MATTPTLILGRDAMGPDATEADFESWVAYVRARVDEKCGYPVRVETRGPGPECRQTNGFGFANTPTEREDLSRVVNELWNDWSVAGALGEEVRP